MKLFICGSRTITDKQWVFSILEDFVKQFKDIEILEGEAQGVDILAKEWAITHGIKVTEYPPEREKYHFKAGYIRNEQMAV